MYVCLAQNSKGSVEVAAKCFYRRKDLPVNLVAAADRHASELSWAWLRQEGGGG